MTVAENLPRDLKESGHFCTFLMGRRPGEEKPTKVPYNPLTGGKAQSNNPKTFTTFAAAEAAQARYSGMGVGVFDGLGAIDIDDCVHEADKLSEMAQDIVKIAVEAGAYVERSPSGAGIRILFWIPGFVYDKKKYYINRRSIGLEVYVTGATYKFLTVTGDTLYGCETMPDFSAGLRVILDRYMVRPDPIVFERQQADNAGILALSDGDVVKKAENAKNGQKFIALMAGDMSGYKSHSEADMGLCNMLAFWTGGNAMQMDRIFRDSGLMRPKWNRPQSGSTYGEITVQKAIDSCMTVYDPKRFMQDNIGKKRRDKETMVLRKTKGIVEELAELRPEKSSRYTWSDMGNGHLFADVFKDIARYVPERKKWFVYNGIRWLPDIENLNAMVLCKQLAGALVAYAHTLKDEDLPPGYLDFVKTWRKRNQREMIIKDAASEYPVGIGTFDVDPHLFNCLNGTLNLETGEFKPHNPGDMLSKVAGVVYSSEVRCARWERFIDEVMQGDAEKAAFLQKALGYALAGDTRHECFFILYGPKSRNGKGTTMETFMRLVGDYGKAARPDTIAQKQMANGSGPSEDIARLAGARFVNISEPDQRLVLSTALVKTLTGNDTITARYLHENSFEYRPAFKLFINTNYLPKVTDVTLFTSGRVKMIPFERHFSPDEQDGGLKDELARAESLSGILNWCIKGLRLMKEQGLHMPDSCEAAAEEYRVNSDKLGRFLADELIEDARGEVRTVDAYRCFVRWCDLNGFRPENAANFKAMLANVAEVKYKRATGAGRLAAATNYLIGYRLRHNGDFIPVDDPSPWGVERVLDGEQMAMSA